MGSGSDTEVQDLGETMIDFGILPTAATPSPLSEWLVSCLPKRVELDVNVCL